VNRALFKGEIHRIIGGEITKRFGDATGFKQWAFGLFFLSDKGRYLRRFAIKIVLFVGCLTALIVKVDANKC